MQGKTEERLHENIRHCRDCDEIISNNAKKCKHCGSHQDWQHRLHLSNTLIALLIALISVSTQLVQYVDRATKKENSSVLALFQGSDDNKISILFSNTGNRPALIEGGSLSGYTDESYQIVLPLAPKISGVAGSGLPEKSQKEAHLYIPRLGFRASRDGLIRKFNYGDAKTKILVNIKNFDGTKTEFEFSGRGRDFLPFIKSEWKRLRED